MPFPTFMHGLGLASFCSSSCQLKKQPHHGVFGRIGCQFYPLSTFNSLSISSIEIGTLLSYSIRLLFANGSGFITTTDYSKPHNKSPCVCWCNLG